MIRLDFGANGLLRSLSAIAAGRRARGADQKAVSVCSQAAIARDPRGRPQTYQDRQPGEK